MSLQPSRDPQEPATPVGSRAGTPSLGRESSTCMPCTNTRPLLIKRTNQDVSKVVMTPSAAGIWQLFFQQYTRCSAGSSWWSCAEQRVPRAGTAASPGDLQHWSQPIHSPRALLQGLFRDCCHEGGTVKPDWLQSVLLSHSLTTKLLSTSSV